MDDLISRSALIRDVEAREIVVHSDEHPFDAMRKQGKAFRECVDNAIAVDAVEINALRAWLYEIAMNNTDNYLCDACEEIISRLDGLRAFARERKENETD